MQTPYETFLQLQRARTEQLSNPHISFYLFNPFEISSFLSNRNAHIQCLVAATANCIKSIKFLTFLLRIICIVKRSVLVFASQVKARLRLSSKLPGLSPLFTTLRKPFSNHRECRYNYLKQIFYHKKIRIKKRIRKQTRKACDSITCTLLIHPLQ